MAAPLSTRTTIEQRGVVRFLWAKKMEAKDIHKEMLPMSGEHCLKLQIQVTTYVLELSAGNCHRYTAALVTHNDRYAHDRSDVPAVTRWRRP